MAQVKFISTSSDKIPEIEVKAGQVIFSKDDRVIYLDTNVRTAYRQIIEIDTDLQRTSLAIPLKGFYFVKSTNVLWRYDTEWVALTESPKQQIVFARRAEFPSVGDENTLYIDGLAMYRYLGRYLPFQQGGSQWQDLEDFI